MTEQYNHLPQELYSETWKEELARAKKYSEATQKRRREKTVRKDVEALKKKTAIGRLQFEP